MNNNTNGGKLKIFKAPCLKDGACDEVKNWNELVDIEEIGYRNGIMHVRCLKCGYERHGEGIIYTETENLEEISSS